MTRRDDTPLKVNVGARAHVPPAKERAQETPEYVLVIRKHGGGLSVTEGECVLSSVSAQKAFPPDAADSTIERILRLIERRFLR
jgi:hypothetical protein